MKMSIPTFDSLRDAVQRADTDHWRTAYREGRYPRSERTRDVNLRYRWDLLWSVMGRLPDAARCEINTLKDDHIDTALRRIVPCL